MRRILTMFLGFFILSFQAEAAAIVTSLTFPSGTFAEDNSSGNHNDFSFEHFLPGDYILSGKIDLMHSDNSNDGPRKEIWHLLSASDQFVGSLSNSEVSPQKDTWTFSQSVLDAMNLNLNKSFAFFLSEQTAYNSEKISLYESRLTLQVSDAVNAPEPSAGLLFLIGLLLLKISKKKAEPHAL